MPSQSHLATVAIDYDGHGDCENDSQVHASGDKAGVPYRRDEIWHPAQKIQIIRKHCDDVLLKFEQLAKVQQ